MDGYSLLALDDSPASLRLRASLKILHAVWHDGEPRVRPAALCLWAEGQPGQQPAMRAARSRGRLVSKASNGGEPHPLAVGVDGIRDSLATLLGLFDLPAMGAADITLHLAAALPGPEGSGTRPLMPADVPRADGAADVIPMAYRVPACRLLPHDAVLLLSGLTPQPNEVARVGDDLAVWCAASRWLMGRLLKDGDVRQDGDLEELAQAMPPLAHATAYYPMPGRILLERFVGEALDGLLRLRQNARWSPPRQWPPAARTWGEQVLQRHSGDAPSLLPVPMLPRTATVPLLLAPPFRLCFRLESPPDPGTEDWCLRFLVQAVDDPSLVVAPADDLQRDCLQADLARAAQVYPRLLAANPADAHDCCTLSLTEVGDFLVQSARALQECGFTVQVPSWMEREKSPVKLRLRVSESRGSFERPAVSLGLEALVDYQWEVALGNDLLSLADFQKLAALKLPVVRVRGQWMVLDRQTVQQAIRICRTLSSSRALKLRDAIRMAGGWDFGEDAGPEVELLLEGRLAELQSGETLEELPQPVAFVGELRPYQVRGFSWLSFLRDRGLGACLADDMGLGKTIQLIALVLRDQAGGRVLGPTLIVCPTSVVGNWRRELERFAPGVRVWVHHGIDRLAQQEFQDQAMQHEVVITTYPLCVRDARELSAVPWEGLVLDEAQNVKNAQTMQARSIRGIPARYRVALTGTPVENRLSDLWSIMEFLNPGLLGSHEAFQRRYGLAGGRSTPAPRLAKLRSLLRPFILRRLKTDPLVIRDLPEKHEMKVYCTLTREQATLYQATVQDMLDKIDRSRGMQRRGMVLTTILRLKQICDHPSLFLDDKGALSDRSGKLTRLVEMLEELLETDDCALVFTQFREMGRLLVAHLSSRLGTEVLYLHGGVSQKQRDEMVQRFQAEDGPRIFVLSVRAGGLGLNLTRANHVFHFDRWWNPAVENQATDRAFRIGQRRNVQVHKFICIGTLEEAIDRLIESKLALAETVIGAGEGWLTELSTDQLRGLFVLRQEALEDDDIEPEDPPVLSWPTDDAVEARDEPAPAEYTSDDPTG